MADFNYPADCAGWRVLHGTGGGGEEKIRGGTVFEKILDKKAQYSEGV